MPSRKKLLANPADNRTCAKSRPLVLGATSMKNCCSSSDKIGETTEFERSLHDASGGVTGLCV